MGRIQVLSEDLVSLISAGEVIENPSSIVKELIENSLDADSTRIDILIDAGGIDSIIVSDNGYGILKEDLPLCMMRYSTSKISKKEDIESITTYGFRGEALASVVAVADVKITSRSSEEETGASIISKVGEIPIQDEIGRNPGTTVTVTDLFKKVPARRKHLSTPSVEARRIHDIVMRHALVRSDVGFRLIKDGKVIIDCPENQPPFERVMALWGTEISQSLVECDFQKGQVKISGYVARPPASRGNRGRECFSVLRRPIQDTHLSSAVEAAYSTTLMKGRYPICVIDISLIVSRIDVNVHPTKREVRILNIGEIGKIVRDAVTETLAVDIPPETITPLDTYTGITVEKVTQKDEVTTSAQISSGQRSEHMVEKISLEEMVEGEEDILSLDVLGGIFKILGQIQDLYILLEFEDCLMIIDQHAAHERILYERLSDQIRNGTVIVQELLEPLVLHLSSQEAESILELGDELHSLGFSVSYFGGNEILVSTLPEILGRRASEQELLALVDRILDIGIRQAKDEFMDELIKVTACHSALRAGQSLSNEEIRQLLLELADAPRRYNCCHGRPSIIRIDRVELDKLFGRDGADAIARFKARHGLR